MKGRFDPGAWAVERLTNARVTKGGREIVADCPWCGKPGHMYVNADNGKFICFKCSDENPSKAPNIIPLFAEVEGISQDEAAREIFRASQKFARLRPRSELPDGLSEMADTVLGDTEVEKVDVPLPKGTKRRIPRYVTNRGFRYETAEHFDARFHARLVGGARLVLPIVSPGGRSYTARAIGARVEPKYFNPKDSGHSQLVYGWSTTRPRADLVIVEGPLDVWRVYEHGMSVLGLLGKALHDDQVAQIASLEPKTVIVMLDPEETLAPIKVGARIAPFADRVRVAKLEPGDEVPPWRRPGEPVDPGNCTRSEFWAAVRSAVDLGAGPAAELMAFADAIL